MYSRILVPVDGSATSLRGLDEAINLALATGAHLKVVHVVNEFVPDAGFFPPSYYSQWLAGMHAQGKNLLVRAEPESLVSLQERP